MFLTTNEIALVGFTTTLLAVAVGARFSARAMARAAAISSRAAHEDRLFGPTLDAVGTVLEHVNGLVRTGSPVEAVMYCTRPTARVMEAHAAAVRIAEDAASAIERASLLVPAGDSEAVLNDLRQSVLHVWIGLGGFVIAVVDEVDYGGARADALKESVHRLRGQRDELVHRVRAAVGVHALPVGG